MAGSGVLRLRLARKGGGSNPRMKNPSSGKGNDVKPNVNVGSDLAPKKSSTIVKREVPSYTPPPISDEQPSRGEHGRNPHRTSRKD